VAVKIRLGQGESAWTTFRENFEANSDFGPQTCTTGQDLAECPPDNIKAVPVRKALAQFLLEAGYTPLPEGAEQDLSQP
jgi:hypothetical protein